MAAAAFTGQDAVKTAALASSTSSSAAVWGVVSMVLRSMKRRWQLGHRLLFSETFSSVSCPLALIHFISPV